MKAVGRALDSDLRRRGVLDVKCTEKLPINLPDTNEIRVGFLFCGWPAYASTLVLSA